jgi:dephospho-CoA kinase
MITIGLTGSIGMGKSATAQIFREQNIPVFDSDACVHALYAEGGEAVVAVGNAFAGVVIDGIVDRQKLSQVLSSDADGYERLEQIVHPLVNLARERFLDSEGCRRAKIVVFDIPLLFETGAADTVDYIIVVSAPDEVRRARVLRRPGMTVAKLDAIIARQTPESLKLKAADFVVETSHGIDDARGQVRDILRRLGSSEHKD